jgi:23S rRNA (pseudouridine1915-N3)-methyltransferase
MHITIVAVGKAKSGPAAELFTTYLSRISTWQVSLKEVEEKRPLPTEKRIEKEGALLLDQVPQGAFVVMLDERGKDLKSTDFAKKLQQVQDEGQQMVFLIGGADGHAKAVKQRANLSLSFGSATWPHMMVRGMLAEQLYRAETILKGHPYHRE